MGSAKKLRRWRKNNPEKVKKSRHKQYIKNRDKEIKAEKKYKATPKGMYVRYKCVSKRNKRNFNLSFIDFCYLISSPCYYCGDINLPFNGVDRVDNNKGYFLNNCVSCCPQCNRMKMNHLKDDFINKVIKIYSKWGEQYRNLRN